MRRSILQQSLIQLPQLACRCFFFFYRESPYFASLVFFCFPRITKAVIICYEFALIFFTCRTCARHWVLIVTLCEFSIALFTHLTYLKSFIDSLNRSNSPCGKPNILRSSLFLHIDANIMSCKRYALTHFAARVIVRWIPTDFPFLSHCERLYQFPGTLLPWENCA